MQRKPGKNKVDLKWVNLCKISLNSLNKLSLLSGSVFNFFQISLVTTNLTEFKPDLVKTVKGITVNKNISYNLTLFCLQTL